MPHEFTDTEEIIASSWEDSQTHRSLGSYENPAFNHISPRKLAAFDEFRQKLGAQILRQTAPGGVNERFYVRKPQEFLWSKFSGYLVNWDDCKLHARPDWEDGFIDLTSPDQYSYSCIWFGTCAAGDFYAYFS